MSTQTSRVTPDDHTAANFCYQATSGDRVIKETQGKLLGGSSGINGQAFVAPTKAGIDGWAKLGATSWTWETLSPYYKKAFTLQLPDEATRDHIGIHWVDPKVNGDSGPIKVSFPAVRQDPLSKAWVDTFQEIGYGVTADPFSGVSIGGYSNLAAIDAETRHGVMQPPGMVCLPCSDQASVLSQVRSLVG